MMFEGGKGEMGEEGKERGKKKRRRGREGTEDSLSRRKVQTPKDPLESSYNQERVFVQY